MIGKILSFFKKIIYKIMDPIDALLKPFNIDLNSFFSNKDTPSCVGLITETFRKIDGVFRTNHPTHSVAIRGKL